MNLIRVAIERPTAVIAAVIMVVMFGWVALQAIPIQLAPDVNRPVITVQTIWPGAAPVEVEREIVNRQEDVLKGLEGLETITSRAETGRARVSLEFAISTNMDRALLLVANRLDRVSNYPDEVDEPTLDTSGSDDNPIAWFNIIRLPGNERPIHTYGDFVDDVLVDRLERVPGVSAINVFGGSERQIEIIVEPELLARYQLTVTEVVASLRAANASVSAGDVEEGKRRYVVRTEGELDTLQAVGDVVLRSEGDGLAGVGRVTVDDIAVVRFGYTDPTARIRMNGQSALAMNATRETGANVIETMEGIRAALTDLRAFQVPNAGLELRQVYDETVYINSSIALVNQNIYVGGTLAALLLLIFLRSGRATLIVSLAIPVSVIGAFVAMAALGRSINVISLAGLAFAIGMVVDAAIVVLENIYRLRERGLSAAEAAYKGASQVWGAVLVSALTTVMVFIPVLIMELEVGQLFRDIAVAISVAVLLSLVVSITVIPALSNWLFGLGAKEGRPASITRMRLPLIDNIADGFVRAVVGFQRRVVTNRLLAISVVSGMTVIAGAAAWLFLPKLEYLPEGNRNLVLGIVIPPPGYNLSTTSDIARGIEDSVRHLWTSESGPEREADGPPKIERFFFVATRSTTFVGAISEEAQNAGELVPVLRGPVFSEPGTFGFINQPSIFGRGIGSGRTIELDISGDELESIVPVAQEAAGRITQIFPFSEDNQLRPNPGLELGAPEVRVLPDRMALADTGVSARELADTLDAFNDGLRVAEITIGIDRMDLVLEGPELAEQSTQGIGNLPVVTSSGQILPTEALADVILTAGPTEIRHRERLRTITLELRPRPGLPLEAAVERLEQEVIQPMRDAGLPPDVRMSISGTADKLSETWDAMIWDLLLAVVIVYLVMAVLFESFVYPLIMLLAVPLAAAGGIGGLALLNLFTYQPLDMLTLLGFVILIGIVVNNAILLVHQTLQQIREEGVAPEAAILEATRNRIRPIFMSTLTSVFGMLPLVIFPGAGSELYRGLGSVVVGGLSMSAVLTLLVVPPMLSLLVGTLEDDRTAVPAARLPDRAEPQPGE
ncbi:efflux RND transporter permease subunit [Algihabitans sp.]|uniref:efflux RND transporter permease subunit n=1 Tax=Algihabitans sp. TaxID=2821514 RepID=UPI003BAC51E9